MDEITKSIYDSYKSGQYFKDAAEWYSLKYLYPSIQRFTFSFYIILFIFSSIILFTTANYIGNKPEKYIYSVFLKDTLGTKAIIKELDHPISSEFAVASYLIKNYVIKYESYNYFNLPQQFEYVKNNSTREVMLEFYHKMDLANDQSPLLKYQKNTEVILENIAVNFQDNYNEQQNTAIISFKKVIYSKVSKQIISQDMQVMVSYEISNLEKVVNKEKPLIFKVKEYTIINS